MTKRVDFSREDTPLHCCISLENRQPLTVADSSGEVHGAATGKDSCRTETATLPSRASATQIVSTGERQVDSLVCAPNSHAGGRSWRGTTGCCDDGGLVERNSAVGHQYPKMYPRSQRLLSVSQNSCAPSYFLKARALAGVQRLRFHTVRAFRALGVVLVNMGKRSLQVSAENPTRGFNASCFYTTP